MATLKYDATSYAVVTTASYVFHYIKDGACMYYVKLTHHGAQLLHNSVNTIM